ncbi:MAG: hypothetical protein ACR2OU_12840 [Thermomicrobiales bacterium]
MTTAIHRCGSVTVETISPFVMTGSRFFLAAPFMFAIAAPAYHKGKMRLTWPEIRYGRAPIAETKSSPATPTQKTSDSAMPQTGMIGK